MTFHSLLTFHMSLILPSFFLLLFVSVHFVQDNESQTDHSIISYLNIDYASTACLIVYLLTHPEPT